MSISEKKELPDLNDISGGNEFHKVEHLESAKYKYMQDDHQEFGAIFFDKLQLETTNDPLTEGA